MSYLATMKSIAGYFLILLLFLQSGCATIITGSRQEVLFTSVQDSVFLRINENPVGHTPIIVRLKKNKPYTFSFEKHGFPKQYRESDRKVSLWLITNLTMLYGAPIGAGFDFLTGAAYEQREDSYHIDLSQPADSIKQVKSGTRP